jgi:putative oxidoreductase
MFEQSSVPEPRNTIGDWAVRGGFAVLFVSAGAEKFGSSGGWVELFQQIGFGDWFRYFTAVLEVLGAVLLLIPWTVTAGLALLGCIMFSAALLWIFRLGHPANAIFSAAFFGSLAAFWWTRRSR